MKPTKAAASTHRSRRPARIRAAALVLATALLAGACGAPAPAPDEVSADAGTPAPEPIPVRVSLFSWPGYGFWFIAREKNLVPEIALDISIIEDPYESFALMSAGQLDIASSTVEYGPIAADEGVPLKLVAFTNPSNGTDKIILAPGIESAADLVGKQVAVLEGGLTQIYLGIWLEQQGVAFDAVEYVNLVMDDAVAAMVSGSVAAGEFWEPFGSQILDTLEGSRVASTSQDEYFKETALLADGIYMADAFIQQEEAAALALKAYFEAVRFWKENPEEGNRIIAEGLKFEVADVELVIGKDGSSADGGLYPFEWAEAARFLGLLDGDPPFGSHGQIAAHWDLTTEWWLKFGFVEEAHPMEAGIDLGPMANLKAGGYPAP